MDFIRTVLSMFLCTLWYVSTLQFDANLLKTDKEQVWCVCLSASLSHLMIFIIIFCLVSQSNTLYSKRKIHNSGHNGAKAEVVLYFLLFLLYHYLLSLVIVQHFVFKTKNDNSGHNWAKVILKSYYIFYIISTNSLRGCFKPFTFEE